MTAKNGNISYLLINTGVALCINGHARSD